MPRVARSATGPKLDVSVAQRRGKETDFGDLHLRSPTLGPTSCRSAATEGRRQELLVEPPVAAGRAMKLASASRLGPASAELDGSGTALSMVAFRRGAHAQTYQGRHRHTGSNTGAPARRLHPVRRILPRDRVPAVRKSRAISGSLAPLRARVFTRLTVGTPKQNVLPTRISSFGSAQSLDALPAFPPPLSVEMVGAGIPLEKATGDCCMTSSTARSMGPASRVAPGLQAARGVTQLVVGVGCVSLGQGQPHPGFGYAAVGGLQVEHRARAFSQARLGKLHGFSR